MGGEVFLVHAVKACRGVRGISPLILGTKWKWVVNFASPSLYFRESSPLPVGQGGG